MAEQNLTAEKEDTEISTHWSRLDNAGKLYPSLVSSRNTTLFRISALLDKPVHAEILQESLNRLSSRFPYYQVHLQRGAFWYYFTPSEHPLILERDSRYPCNKMPIRQRTRFPFRIRAFKNQVAVEFSHILTDGTGALVYFQSLIADYLKHRENLSGSFEGILLPEDPQDPEESEDAFQRYYVKNLPQPPKLERAFKYRDDLEPKGVYHVTTGLVKVKELKKLASEQGVSITTFLTATMIEVFQDSLFRLPPRIRRRFSAPIRICIPVNLRRFFPSKTMRNFFLSLFPGIDPRLGKHSFEDICSQVGHYMEMNLNRRVLAQQISRNIQGEKTLFIRLLPSWIKDLIIPGIYRRFGESAYTTVISNLGQVPFPEILQPYIKRLDFIPNPPEGTTRVKVGIVSYKEDMSISFGRISKESFVEREFFRKLRKRGLAIRVDSNSWKDEE